MKFCNLRKFGPKIAVSGLLAVPVVSNAATTVADITTAIEGNLTSASGLALSVVAGLFAVWGVFLLLKAKRG